jgi:TonB family protein
MPEYHKKKQFLNLPKYTGGSDAFRKFINANLRYPDTALEARAEGTVIVEYDILDNGHVQHPRILKGIGHGCDEEAMRVVGMLQYEKVKNRGVRVKVTTKTNIQFKFPGVRINYSAASEPPPSIQGKKPESKNPGSVVYEYTVTF